MPQRRKRSVCKVVRLHHNEIFYVVHDGNNHRLLVGAGVRSTMKFSLWAYAGHGAVVYCQMFDSVQH